MKKLLKLGRSILGFYALSILFCLSLAGFLGVPITFIWGLYKIRVITSTLGLWQSAVICYFYIITVGLLIPVVFINGARSCNNLAKTIDDWAF